MKPTRSADMKFPLAWPWYLSVIPSWIGFLPNGVCGQLVLPCVPGCSGSCPSLIQSVSWPTLLSGERWIDAVIVPTAPPVTRATVLALS
ncbi:hypothetical protein EI94DRAFT_1727880 [Lactarius quietus]|nr:hypothetical protein EI94DRAFT_1727880 [Lactarius quietus]